MTISFIWKVYCVTEGVYKDIVASTSDQPLCQCPTDATHQVTPETMFYNSRGNFVDRTIVLSDKKVSGSAGGTFASGTWVTRTLNSIDGADQTFCTLSSNVFTLPPGKYTIEGTAPGFNCGAHQCRIINNDTNEVLINGTCEYTASSSVQTRSFIKHSFEITAQTSYILQHRCGTTSSTSGLGKSTGFGTSGVLSEVYSNLIITKHALY